MSELEDVCHHVHDKISSLQRLLDLSAVEIPQSMIKKLGQELITLHSLLEDFEKCVDKKKEQLMQLKELEETFQKGFDDVQHLKANMPAHMPKKRSLANGSEAQTNPKQAADVGHTQLKNVKKTNKSLVREMELITVPEYERIPQYMKGRVSYEQLNASVQSINIAISAKYKILHQSAKTLNNHARKLQQRFKDQETKDTKAQHFVVEDDIREFTQMKVDKRFQGILNMLRHCQRLRELRGGGLTRYVLL